MRQAPLMEAAHGHKLPLQQGTDSTEAWESIPSAPAHCGVGPAQLVRDESLPG